MRRLPWLVLTALLVAGCGRQASPVASTVLPSLQLRHVVSEAEGACTAPPLLTDAAGTSCSFDGRWSYALGPSLADLQPVSARFGSDPLGLETNLEVRLDRAGVERFADVSGDSIGRRVAVLFDGRVVTAPVIQSRIEGDLQITGDDATLRALGRALHAAPASSRSPERADAFPTLDPALEVEQARVCAAAQPRLAPGLTGDGGLGLVQAPFTASRAAAMLAGMGDGTGAAVWRRLPAGDRAFLCSYSSPVDPNAPVPNCPPGQSPVVGMPAVTRTFFVDARGHASELRPPYPMPVETCSVD